MADPDSILVRLTPHYRKEQLLLDAAWRYQVMSPLLQPGLTRQQRTGVRKRILGARHPHPWKGLVSVSARSLRRWCQQYKLRRLQGLMLQERRDRCKSRKLPAGALDMARQIFLEDESLGATQLRRLMLAQKPEWEKQLSRSTLDRHMRAMGLVRRARSVEACRRFEASRPHDIWQGDILHGPEVWVGDKLTTAKIVTWIDDFSRFVLHLQAFDNERLPVIEHTLTQSILKYGQPGLIYVDNGQVYCSHALTMACSQLGITKRHTKPRRPQGKGKQERFYRTLRGQLLNEIEKVEPITLQRLNELLACWLSLYHSTVHSKTKETPSARCQQGTIRPVDRVALEEAFLQWTERKVTKQGIIEFAGQEYYADISLAGLRLIIRYDPFDISKIYLWREGKKIGQATPEQLIYPTLARAPKPDEKKNSAYSERYLQTLEEGYLRRLQSQVNQIQLPDGGAHE